MGPHRYGLPVNFQAMLLQPNKKTMKKLREVLYDLYKHLDSSAAAIIDVSSNIHPLCQGKKAYREPFSIREKFQSIKYLCEHPDPLITTL